MIGAAADCAEHADQSLREHAIQRRNKVVRFDAHVQEAADHVDDVVRVNGREHEMARQRRLNRDLRGFFVTNFADHDLVGIVTQNRTKTTRERQAFLLVHRNLRDAVELILDRVFDRDDFVFFVSDFVQRRVERRRLT